MSEHALVLWVIAVLLTILGLAGMLLPALPGAPLLFLGLFCGAWAEDFHYVGMWTLAILGVMAAMTYVVEGIAALVGVKKYGGSRRAMAGAAIGGTLGLFLGIPGIILGPFIGAVLGELSQQRTLNQATRAGMGTVVGMAIGVAGKFAIGIAMVGTFALVRLFP